MLLTQRTAFIICHTLYLFNTAVPNLLHLISHLVQAKSSRFPLIQPLHFCFIFAAWGSVVSSSSQKRICGMLSIAERLWLKENQIFCETFITAIYYTNSDWR